MHNTQNVAILHEFDKLRLGGQKHGHNVQNVTLEEKEILENISLSTAGREKTTYNL